MARKFSAEYGSDIRAVILLAVFITGDAAFVSSVKLENPLESRASGSKRNQIYTCSHFYSIQNSLRATHIGAAGKTSYGNCTFPAKGTVPTSLTSDGYLRVHTGESEIYYPPTRFCISSENTARLCKSPDSPFPIWKKCCPEHQVLSKETHPRICVNSSSSRFRPKIEDTPYPFIVKSTSAALDFICPAGYYLHKLSTSTCNIRRINGNGESSSLSSIFWNSDKNANAKDDDNYAPCSHCRFRLLPNGSISYEEAMGVFLRKSQWKMVNPNVDSYCIDGEISPTVSDCDNEKFDHVGCNDKGVKNDIVKGQSAVILYICVKSEGLSAETDTKDVDVKATLLTVIWLLTCPLLLGAAVGNFIIQRNVHGWILTCYLLSLCFLNILSVLLLLNVGRKDKDNHKRDEYVVGGCHPMDFLTKFTYMSTLCWMTSINFGLWKTFRYTLPEPVGIRRFITSASFSLLFPVIPVSASYYMARLGSDPNCEAEYCVLFSYDTIPFYQVPVFLLVFGNFAIFIKTSCRIATLRKEASEILQRQAQDHLKSFTLFTKLFLLSGSIWLIRLVLFFLQLQGMYLSWYGVILEMLFSASEIVFPMIVFHHPEFIKWSWNKAPKLSGLIVKINPFFKTETTKRGSIQKPV